MTDLSLGLREHVDLICFDVGGWHDFGYETPPTPDCKTIPPLGERSAKAIGYGHDAVEAIDELMKQLYALRSQLVTELRQNADLNAARADELLAKHKNGA